MNDMGSHNDQYLVSNPFVLTSKIYFFTASLFDVRYRIAWKMYAGGSQSNGALIHSSTIVILSACTSRFTFPVNRNNCGKIRLYMNSTHMPEMSPLYNIMATFRLTSNFCIHSSWYCATASASAASMEAVRKLAAKGKDT